MKNSFKRLSRPINSFMDFKVNLNKIKYNNFSTEIKIKAQDQKLFYPSRVPEFEKGKLTIFEYKPEEQKTDTEGSYVRLPQVPYEIKEHALKGVLYTAFLSWGGRFLSNFSDAFLFGLGTYYHLIPASVFAFQYLKSLQKMYNAITAIRLKEDGRTVIFEFKLRRPIEVEIKRITKNREENFLMESYTEPFLFPLVLDYADVYSAYSLKSRKVLYLYGDSSACIKNGEFLRAVINGQSIKLK